MYVYIVCNPPATVTSPHMRICFQDDSAAHWHELQLEEKAINILSRSCAVELENSALTVQIKDLLRAQGIQHPDNLPQTPVFTEHNLEVITNVDGLYASLAAAFWASNAAQQKVLRRCLDDIKHLLSDRVCIIRLSSGIFSATEVKMSHAMQEILMRERDWKCHQEEIQKKRCYEVITARDKKYETDTRQLKLRLERSQSELTQQKQLVHVLRARCELPQADAAGTLYCSFCICNLGSVAPGLIV